jgi:FAD-linked oxidoreductase
MKASEETRLHLSPAGWSRRELLAAAAAAASMPLLSACSDSPRGHGHAHAEGEWQNWSGGVRARPAAWKTPGSDEALAQVMREAPGSIRPVGAGHSFSAVAASDDTMVSLDGMRGLIDHDPQSLQASFHAGTRIREAAPALEAIGQGFVNQGDVDPQALGGAIGTSTHGTGIGLGSFSSMVTALRLVTPDGAIIDASPDQEAEVYHAACTSVGALGVISRLRLQNRAAYRLHEREYTLPLAELMQNAESLRDQHRHFEFFGFFKSDTGLVKTLDETDAEPTPAERLQLPVDAIMFLASEAAHRMPSTDAALQRLLMRAAPSSERIGRSWEIFPSDRNVRFNEMEYEVPAERGLECLEEIIAAVRKADINVLFPFEYRYVAADDCWLSPFYQRASASISVHQYWKVDHRPLFDLLEPIFLRYDGRPHWGKLHTLKAEALAERYPRWDDFQAVRRRLDPKGRMLSPYLRGLFEGGAA